MMIDYLQAHQATQVSDELIASLQRYTFILIFARKPKKKEIVEGSFYLTRPLLLGEAPHPLLNPPLLRREGLNR